MGEGYVGQLMQILLNAATVASFTVLVAVGFSLILDMTRSFHFAHAATYTCAAYVTFAGTSWLGMPLTLAAPIGVAFCVSLGCLIERLIYRPMRRRGASSLTLLIASLGTYLVVQNVISLIWGDDTRLLRSAAMDEGIEILRGQLTRTSSLAIALGAALPVAVGVLLRSTSLGCAMRAVAADTELARIRGVPTECVILEAFAIASALAGVGGILFALDVNMRPTMGMSALMTAIVAVIIGGVGSIAGVMLGSFLLALAQQIVTWTLGAQWQDPVVFATLLAFLLLRPQGIFGKPLRKRSI